MYEQGVDADETELMNSVAEIAQQDESEKLNALKTTAGSLFLDSGTAASQDTLRKLREDPLFTIRQEEYRQQQGLASNPLYQARLRAHAEKKLKKEMEKAAKKEKKEEKKKEKKEKKEEKKK